jgi:hypothetical protein
VSKGASFTRFLTSRLTYCGVFRDCRPSMSPKTVHKRPGGQGAQGGDSGPSEGRVTRSRTYARQEQGYLLQGLAPRGDHISAREGTLLASWLPPPLVTGLPSF